MAHPRRSCASTYPGDASLDGKLNIDDYVKIDQGIANGYTGWANGDFNYDGKIDIDDYVILDGNLPNQVAAGECFDIVGGVGELDRLAGMDWGDGDAEKRIGLIHWPEAGHRRAARSAVRCRSGVG